MRGSAKLLAQNVPRGSIFKALSRRFVEPIDHALQVAVRYRRDVGVERQEAPDAAVGVLDAALLPRRRGLAEIGDDV